MALSASLILVFAIITYVLVRQNTDSQRSNLAEQSKSFAALATKPIGDTFVLYKDSGRIRINQQINRFLELDPDVVSVTIVGIDGQPLFDSSETASQPIDPALANSFQQQVTTDPAGNPSRVIEPYIEDSGAHRYSVVYNISSERLKEEIAEVGRSILYIGLAVLIFSIALTTILLNKFFIKPISEVSRTARLISAGELDHKISVVSKDEIGELAKSVSTMAETLKSDIHKLRELDKMKSEFMMITSHNLRTPLTIMEGYVEMAKEAKSVEQLQEIINTISTNVTRLGLFAEDILTISTLESGEQTVRHEPLNAKDLLDNLFAEFEQLAISKGLAWKAENSISEETIIQGSKSHLNTAIGNVLDNAIKFTKKGGSVTVTASRDVSSIKITVSDTGIGISSEELPKIFIKFHRGTSTMTYDYEGTGIGLYLTRLILQQHGGSINATSKLGVGSVFVLAIPASAQAS